MFCANTPARRNMIEANRDSESHRPGWWLARGGEILSRSARAMFVGPSAGVGRQGLGPGSRALELVDLSRFETKTGIDI